MGWDGMVGVSNYLEALDVDANVTYSEGVRYFVSHFVDETKQTFVRLLLSFLSVS
jgi:hypothetical protein